MLLSRNRIHNLGRQLTLQEKQRYQPYFSSVLLDKVRVVEERVVCGGQPNTMPFWLHPNMHGLVLGYTIYLRGGAYQADKLCGIELLAHELVHVEQFANGMTIAGYLWASRRGYRQNMYEIEAYERAKSICRSMA